MKFPLILFLVAAVVPVFFGKIRSAPFWLAVQAVALGWASAAQHGQWSAHALAALVEVLVVRAVIAPLLLRRAIRGRGEPNLDLMPSNLFAWAIAIALLVLAFEFGAPEMSDRHALALGAVGATVAVALLLLAANDSPPAQLVAVLFMENAMALFESLLPEPWPLPVHLALSAIYLLTVGVGAWLIGRPPTPAPAALTLRAVEEGRRS
jgi:hydrogenase-4 membrane subunit HyfE